MAKWLLAALALAQLASPSLAADPVTLPPGMSDAPDDIAEGAWIEMRYATYLERQQTRIDRQIGRAHV